MLWRKLRLTTCPVNSSLDVIKNDYPKSVPFAPANKVK